MLAHPEGLRAEEPFQPQLERKSGQTDKMPDLTSLELTVGGRFFDLPDTPSLATIAPVRGGLGTDNEGLGPSVDWAFRRRLSDTGFPVFIELAGFAAWTSFDDAAALNGGGNVALAMTGLTSGLARADVATRADAAGSRAGGRVRAVDSTGTPGSIDNTVSTGTGFSSNVSTTLISSGVLNSYLVADGRSAPSATAFGAALTDQGFAVAAAGELDGVQFRSDVESDFLFLGGELRVGLADLTLGPARLSPFLAPALRHYSLQTDTRTSLSVTPPATPAGTPPLPAQSASISVSETLEGRYYGAVAGADVTMPVTERLALDAALSVGLFHLEGDYAGHQAATLQGGIAGTSSFAGPSISDSDGRAAYSARLDLGLGYDLGPGTLHLSGTLEYLSDVPSVARVSQQVSASATFGTAASRAGNSGPPAATSRLAFDDMLSIGAALRFVATF